MSFIQQTTDKNYDILCYLRDYKLSDESTEKIFTLLDNPDERIRFAALEVLLEQAAEKVPEKVERFLLDTTAENTRLRQAAIEAFIEKDWTLVNKEKFELGDFEEGIKVTKAFKLKRL